jgi:hypothetical protein
MAYTDRNFKTKKAMKDAFVNGEKIHVHQPGGIFPLKTPGTHTIEGPHYPEPHRWYARVEVDVDGYITKVIS